MSALDQLRFEIIESHQNTKSWRKTGDQYGIQPSMARLIANGYIPGAHIRRKLNLPAYAQVIAIAEEIPEGTLVLKATLCPCGQYFISNHPRRKKCFQCSPYRAKKG